MNLRANLRDSEPAGVDLVFFEVGNVRFGADALDVGRVSRLDAGLPCAERLGASRSGRALVVRTAHGEVQVPIDRFVGIQNAPFRSLRALPAVAQGIVEPALVGFFLQAQEIVLLIDLQALVNEANAGEDAGGRQAAIR